MPISKSGQAAKAKMQRAARMQDALRAKLAYAQSLRKIVYDLGDPDAREGKRVLTDLHATEQQIDYMAGKMANEVSSIFTAINKLDDPTAQAIIEMRYMLGWTWPQIAHEINYSERQAQRIHNKAIEEIKFESGC